MLKNIITMLRPREWIKNSFVIAPLIFSGKLLEIDKLKISFIAFISFCLISSSVYIINDIFDIENDKKHPDKKNRPLVSGAISIKVGLIIAFILIALSLTLTIFINIQFFLLIALYIILNILYNIFLKKQVILDVMTLASFFLIRVISGALSINVVISYWILICTFLVSLFMGFAKRRAEIITIEKGPEKHRLVLSSYSTYFIDQMISIVTPTTMVAYILYTISERTVKIFGHSLLLTVPFVLYGLFRYLYLIHQKKTGGNPSRILVSDIPFLTNILLWGITVIAIIYFNKII